MNSIGKKIGELRTLLDSPFEIYPVNRYEFPPKEDNIPYLHSVILEKEYSRMTREMSGNKVGTFLGDYFGDLAIMFSRICDDIEYSLYSKKHEMPPSMQLMIYSNPTNQGGIQFIDHWGVYNVNGIQMSVGISTKNWDVSVHYRTYLKVILA